MRSFMPKIRALKYPMPEVSAEAMQQVMAMSEAERKAFFTEMGNRLEARIADIPDYPEAWMRLARVRLMTGDRDAVLKALQKGIDGSSDPAQAVPLRQMLDKLKNSADN